MADSLEKLFVTQEKNFIKQNILHAKRSYPAEPKQRSVDTRYGDTHDLKRSGLLPIYVHKKNYGKIPRCIVKVHTRVEPAEPFNGDETSRVSACRYIDKEERKRLLDGMKQKWEEAMQRFRRLPFLADTLPKAQKKARMERELQQLEKDIAIIEQHSHIYVYDETINAQN
ncbi:PREDICTED: enkurin [Trachymyrmex cornetzi]|uniref:Enkurin n=1 Tax=Trachymyrmex cornetzi TaxID=471704 RepID=A0A195D9S7_9HYME|nr:PREDICTED: enkurin [Trachymyrmex cornetzi]KYN09633.1 Enkurin [Trachymyrmex cornetzi]